MNEFIVWDKNNKVFVDNRDFYIFQNGELFTEYGKGNLVNINTFKYFSNIGLKDINGKSIYADCSIVELQWKDVRFTILQSGIGYFSENESKKCLEFIFLEHRRPINFVENIDFIFCSKIIDTIQENKLGLIKG